MKLSEQKKLNILAAAEELFFQQGVEHTSMDQVAKLAAVSKRTVYNHFETKEALFYAIINNMKAALENTAEVNFNLTIPIDEQLFSIAQAEVALLTSENFLRIAKIAFLQMLKEPELAKQLGDNKIGCLTYFEQFLRAAHAANVLDIDDFELAAQQFVYQLKSLIFYPRLYGFATPDHTQQTYLIEQTVALFLARYKKG